MFKDYDYESSLRTLLREGVTLMIGKNSSSSAQWGSPWKWVPWLAFGFSCNLKLNLDGLLEELWEYLSLIRVYTKKPGQPPDFDDGLILRRGVTVEHVCHAIHRSLADSFKYALVWVSLRKPFLWRCFVSSICVFFSSCQWLCKADNAGCLTFVFQGTSTKYSPQRVGASHVMADEDVIQVVKKWRRYFLFANCCTCMKLTMFLWSHCFCKRVRQEFLEHRRFPLLLFDCCLMCYAELQRNNNYGIGLLKAFFYCVLVPIP